MASDTELIAEFIRARTEHRTHTPPSERRGAPLALADAYRQQDQLRQTLVGRGERLAEFVERHAAVPARRICCRRRRIPPVTTLSGTVVPL